MAWYGSYQKTGILGSTSMLIGEPDLTPLPKYCSGCLKEPVLWNHEEKLERFSLVLENAT